MKNLNEEGGIKLYYEYHKNGGKCTADILKFSKITMMILKSGYIHDNSTHYWTYDYRIFIVLVGNTMHFTKLPI